MKKQRKRKDAHLNLRITRAMMAKLNQKWTLMIKANPDITFASAVREAIRKGLSE